VADMRAVHANGAAAPIGGYVAGMATTGGLLFVSGQTPEGPDGPSSADPEEQFRQIWRNVSAVLAGAGVGIDALVHVRTFLASREHRDINSRVRREVLAGHEPALTVVICELYDERWVAEIEAIAQLPTAEGHRRE
jgi:2-iminobutanoate/2-iminopropanoate deaminase